MARTSTAISWLRSRSRHLLFLTASLAACRGDEISGPVAGSAAALGDGNTYVLVGAGNIGRCGTTNDEATGRLVDAIPGTVFTAGDNVYSGGTLSDYTNCFDPGWGRHRFRMRPAAGEADYYVTDAGGYFDYFSNTAGPRGLGYYSYDLGDWHIVVLNTSIATHAGSSQEQWLRADLAASNKRCTAAIWHYPRFSSFSTHRRDAIKPLWDALYEAGAEFVVNGHYRFYERYAPQDPDGKPDPNGIRQFIVGTGGTGVNPFDTVMPNSEVRKSGVYGVLKLTLTTDGYTWQFVPISGQVFRDSGSGSCQGPGTGGSSAATVRSGYFVAPNGLATNDGSYSRPWNLATALSGAGGRVRAGDTIWVRGGKYAGDFRGGVSGSGSKPVVVRQYPTERATIDGTLRMDGHDVIVWGLEIMRSAPSGRMPALQGRGPRQKFVNMVIHDAAQQGITFWDEAVDSELYGNIVYNNGTHENLDHGVYIHNNTGTKVVADNVFFNNLAYGIHAYAGPSDQTQRNIHVLGNISFNNGTISTVYPAKGNILIGAEVPAAGMRAKDNLLYYSSTAGVNMQVGYVGSNYDIAVTGNTMFGGFMGLRVNDWQSTVVQGNTIGGSGYMAQLEDSPSGHNWSANRYYRSASASAWKYRGGNYTLAGWKSATRLGSTDGIVASAPSTTQVFVRPNKYEQGRAFITVYNFGKQGSVSVNLSNVLAGGQAFEIRNVQDYFGSPVVSGTYNGGSVTLPMNGVAPPPRLGRSTPTPPRTGPYFDVFVVVPK